MTAMQQLYKMIDHDSSWVFRQRKAEATATRGNRNVLFHHMSKSLSLSSAAGFAVPTEAPPCLIPLVFALTIPTSSSSRSSSESAPSGRSGRSLGEGPVNARYRIRRVSRSRQGSVSEHDTSHERLETSGRDPVADFDVTVRTGE